MSQYFTKNDLPSVMTKTSMTMPRNYNLASEFCKRLMEIINEFDKSLDQDHEVGIRLVNFGETVVFHLEDLGYQNPSLMIFYGITDNDEPVELIQHISQISIMLIKMKRKNPDTAKKPIGFSNQNEGEESSD